MDLDWHTIWSNISLSSRNPDHQMIHYTFTHRFYLTPRRLQQIKSEITLIGISVQTIPLPLFIIWFGSVQRSMDSGIMFRQSCLVSSRGPSLTQCLLLLNDTSSLKLTINNKRLLLAGLTAAKRMTACRWKPPHALSVREWLSSYRGTAQLELCSTFTLCQNIEY